MTVDNRGRRRKSDVTSINNINKRLPTVLSSKMPLPSALAARLSKRGLITPKKQPDQLKKQDFKGLSTCPNKSNVYHECNYWCETHWKGVLTPDPKYVRNMQKLLVKFPLPNNWTEVFDKGVGRYYYWNMENDLVSWLPPRHPKSIKCQSAAKLREKRSLANEEREERKEKERDNEDDDEDRGHRRDRKDRDRDRDRDDRRHRREDRYSRKKSRKDDVDPMDPAAYSDIPQGTWSDGLETNKTRADSTASGVLYQQRPYPAPGEVLAINKEKSKKK